MKRFLFILSSVLVIGCSKYDDTELWDKIHDHETRISVLETLCGQMNTNITSLQTLVNNLKAGIVITNIAPITEANKEIGYTITFSDGRSITIYHGEDGKNGSNGTNGTNGTNGKDGATPTISVAKDTDGEYYWTIDGEWLLDENGNKVKASGTNGTNGTNGANGLTPEVKIEDGYWYIRYGDGEWQQIGIATLSCNCTCGILSITEDHSYVYFTLSDGNVIKILKGNSTIDPKNISFECPYVKAICIRNWDSNGDGELSYEEAATVTSLNGEFSNIEYLTMNYSSVTWNSQVIFLGNHSILSFEELKYFTSLTTLNNDDFSYDINLYKIAFPESLTTIESRGSITIKDVCENRGFTSKTIYYEALTDCPLQSVTLLSKTPIGTKPFFPVNSYCKIYVPEDAVETYKSTWSDYSDFIYVNNK